MPLKSIDSTQITFLRIIYLWYFQLLINFKYDICSISTFYQSMLYLLSLNENRMEKRLVTSVSNIEDKLMNA